MIKTVFEVSGMKCTNCELKVEGAIAALDGIHAVKANHDANNVTVEYDETEVTPAAIKEAVDDLGRFELEL